MENPTKPQISSDNVKMREDLLKEGSIIINSDFDSDLMESIFFKIRKLVLDKNIAGIVIYINSNGGDVTALFPLIDIITGSPKPVNTVVLGKAYSAGAILALCGDKGNRFAYQNSSFLLHEVASMNGTFEKNTQIQINAERVKSLNNKLIKIIEKRTKLSKKQIREFMKSNVDKFISSDQALKYGLIDKIL